MSDENNTTPAPDWRATLPEELKAAPSLKDYKDVAGLAKSHVELQKLMGSSIRVPGPDAPEEKRKEFFTNLQKQVPELVNAKDENALLSALGKPEDPKEYAPAKDIELPEPLVEQVRGYAKELGLTKRQADGLFRAEAARYAKQNELISNSQGELKREWGAALEERTRLAASAAEKMGFPPAALDIIKSGKGSSSEVKAFYNMAKALGLDRPGNELASQPSGTSGKMTPDEARERLREIRGRQEYWKPGINPAEHQRLVKKVVELTEIANAGND